VTKRVTQFLWRVRNLPSRLVGRDGFRTQHPALGTFRLNTPTLTWRTPRWLEPLNIMWRGRS
jgi:hypothetical protein